MPPSSNAQRAAASSIARVLLLSLNLNQGTQECKLESNNRTGNTQERCAGGGWKQGRGAAMESIDRSIERACGLFVFGRSIDSCVVQSNHRNTHLACACVELPAHTHTAIIQTTAEESEASSILAYARTYPRVSAPVLIPNQTLHTHKRQAIVTGWIPAIKTTAAAPAHQP